MVVDVKLVPHYNGGSERIRVMDMEKKLTMQDIAKISGVAKSTVSRYFNGGYVKDDTREKIKKVIEEYNYQPNAFAQSLKAKQSKMIGIIAPCLDSTVSSRIMMAIDEHLRKEGYTSMIINTNHMEQLELDSLENLWRMKVDGIILLATHITEEHKQIIKRIDVPVVVVGQAYEDGISIVNNDFEAGSMVGSYAVKKGHQNIVYLGVEEKDVAVGLHRKQGVLKGCGSDANVHVIESDFSFQKAYEHTCDILEHGKMDMIIAATDTMALGALKALQEKHYKIPEDVSLMGFGGYEISMLITPKLTTIRFNNALAGDLAAETILNLIQHQSVCNQAMIDYEFLEGNSVQDISSIER